MVPEFPFEVGEKIAINRVVRKEPTVLVYAVVLKYYDSDRKGEIDSILYNYKGTLSWEYFTNCRKLTPLEKLI